MDKTTHEIRLANWKQLIEQCASRPKGQTIQQWLKGHGIAVYSVRLDQLSRPIRSPETLKMISCHGVLINCIRQP